MTSKERFRAAVEHRQVDRIPCDFSATGNMYEILRKHYQFTDYEQVREHFCADLRLAFPVYNKKKLDDYIDSDGLRVEETMYGYRQKWYPTGAECCPMNLDFPWDFADKAEDIVCFDWLRADHFDYDCFKREVDSYRDKAVGIGGPGMYQYSTFMRSAENLYMDMALNPDLAKAIFNKFVDFELEYYERQFIAADGQIDYLLCNDDYGTQISMLFSVPMWREFFKDNTKKMADLAHKYGAYYMQHSCGAIRPIIPELIDCGVDILNPLQKVQGLEPEGLQKDFGGKIAFCGGIDAQWLLPGGSPQEVQEECRRFIDCLGQNGGYILGPSQGLQTDVPIENVEALYNVLR